MRRVAFVDDQLLCRDFRTDDVVRKSSLRDYVLTPYSGRVLFSNPRTGKVAVQWPWGVESESPSELVKELAQHFAPTSVDTSYGTYEKYLHTKNENTKKVNQEFRKSLASSIVKDLRDEFETQNKLVFHAACRALHDGMTEPQAKKYLIQKFASSHGFDAVQSIAGDVYAQGYRLAIYWREQNRRYQATKSERNTKRFSCPKCHDIMKPLRYRFRQSIQQCPVCGFSIHNDDIIMNAGPIVTPAPILVEV